MSRIFMEVNTFRYNLALFDCPKVYSNLLLSFSYFIDIRLETIFILDVVLVNSYVHQK